MPKKNQSNESNNTAPDVVTAIERMRSAEIELRESNAALSALSAAAEEKRHMGGSHPVDVQLELLEAQIRRSEAEAALALGRRNATVAVDASEVAAGDSLALTLDARSLHGELLAFETAAAHHRAELRKFTEHAPAQLMARAKEAHAVLSARRREQGLPDPAPLPAPPAGPTFGKPQTLLEAVASRVADGLPAPPRNERLLQMKSEATDLQASIEADRVAAEERAAEEAETVRRRELNRIEGDKTVRAEHEAMVARANDSRREQENLAAAHRARRA